MSKTDELGVRMKGYEGVASGRLLPKTPVIIRVDGKAFHTFTKKLNKPFDELLIDSMHQTLLYLCRNIGGCVLGYTQSDEINLLLQDYKSIETQPYFDYRIEKLCSVVASMATFAFNRAFQNYATDFYNTCSDSRSLFEENKERIEVLLHCCDVGALFDARAFNVPFSEVTNYFYWREKDAIRNAIEMVGHANFSTSQLHKVNCEGIKKKLLEEKGIDLDTFPTYLMRGVCCHKVGVPSFSLDGKPIMRTTWEIDVDIPVFVKEGRSYIEDKIGE